MLHIERSGLRLAILIGAALLIGLSLWLLGVVR
jgi:hypothetical protein